MKEEHKNGRSSLMLIVDFFLVIGIGFSGGFLSFLLAAVVFFLSTTYVIIYIYEETGVFIFDIIEYINIHKKEIEVEKTKAEATVSNENK